MTLLNNLNLLESAGLIRLAQLEPELTYLFRHALVQDAAYASVLPEDRVQLHQLVGESIEILYADRLDDYAAMLAYHFERAGDLTKAGVYYLRAGDAALQAFANQEAAHLYRQALELVDSAEQRAAILWGLGEAALRLNQFEVAVETWRSGIDAYRELGNVNGVARLYAYSARAAWQGGDTPHGLALCHEGIDAIGDNAPESADVALLIHETARAHYFNGNPESAQTWCRRALDMAERLDVVPVLADALATWGVLPHQPPEQALAALTKATQLASSSRGSITIAIRAYHNLGVMTMDVMGDMHLARGHFEKAVELAQTLGSARQELYSLINVGHAYLRLGAMQELRALLPRVDELVKRIPDPDAVQLEVQGLRIFLLWIADETEQALTKAEAFLQDAARQGDLQMRINAGLTIAQLHFDRHWNGESADLQRALDVLMETADLCQRSGIGSGTHVLAEISRVNAELGQIEDAKAWLQQAEDAVGKAPAYWEEVQLVTANSAIAAAEGRWSEAFSAIETAAAIWAQRDLRWTWANIVLRWANLHRKRGQSADLQQALSLYRQVQAAFREMDAPRQLRQAEDGLQAVRAALLQQASAHEQSSAELAAAGRVQASFLPERAPALPGWDVSAVLQPARQMSGDYYDFIPLADGRLALIVADVVDKGASAALYMALSRTYLRHAMGRHPDHPELALQEANDRILAETHTDMFVTVFTAVLSPETDMVQYGNAGHNRPLLVQLDQAPQPVPEHGLALGVLPDIAWPAAEIVVSPGSVLVLYTDGVTEAQNRQREMFGEARLTEIVWRYRHASAETLQRAILNGLTQFTDGAPQYDDITLAIARRVTA